VPSGTPSIFTVPFAPAGFPGEARASAPSPRPPTPQTAVATVTANDRVPERKNLITTPEGGRSPTDVKAPANLPSEAKITLLLPRLLKVHPNGVEDRQHRHLPAGPEHVSNHRLEAGAGLLPVVASCRTVVTDWVGPAGIVRRTIGTAAGGRTPMAYIAVSG